MLAELAAANAAFSVIKQFVSNGKELSGCAKHISDFVFSKEEIEKNLKKKKARGAGGADLATKPMICTSAVRRLTPRECERLQGFPDDYTQISWRGKEPEDCPNGHRYKAMGNSMAVPVMRWIGEGIELVNRIPRTEAPQQEELGWL